MLDQREGPPPPLFRPNNPITKSQVRSLPGPLAVQLIAAAGSTVGFLVEEGAGRD